MNENTPIIVGVGEASERIDAPDYKALSPADLAGAAARAACEDALSVSAIAPAIDVIATIRQFEVSGPNAKPPFGASDNFPRSLAKRIGANPARAILEVVGGQGPQHLVNEFAHAIAAGEMRMALIAGSEAISTVRHLQSKGETRDWSEHVEGALEDRGFGGEGLLTREIAQHGAFTPISLYAMFENARRGRLGMDRQSYALEMGKLFAPFTEVASKNPHAMSQDVHSAESLATVTGPNRLTSDPFPRRMVARDQANQGAAVIITSVGVARALGVPEEKWVYLHGGADVKERTVIERQDLSRGPASTLAAVRALATANKGVGQIDFFDLYSCFPIAVFNVRDGMGVRPDSKRPLTMTGGLPFFGGAGNNYSMHAIASMTRALRANPGKFGFVGANGGFLSKYSVGIYSTTPSRWLGFDSKPLQREVDGWEAPKLAVKPTGAGVIDTYTIDYSGAAPRATVIGTLKATGERFIAMSEDQAIVQDMIEREPLGANVTLAQNDKERTVVAAFAPTR